MATTRVRRIEYTINDRGCYIVTSHRPANGGYPLYYLNGQQMHMHRALYMARYGEVGSLDVLHSCDDKMCINMEHLRAGTRGDNNRDRMVRGRSRPRRGEENGMSKLKLDQILLIRESSVPSRKLAKELGVCKSTINYVRSRQLWAIA